ncbi:transglycosylase domain-containing protein [Rubritalea tangerina]|uniref:Transglycosylase domain-containing protein n=2 Tax=Rubritalea tangerina TaxID=430798 RepID=A0ABW4Z9Z8_9BACT
MAKWLPEWLRLALKVGLKCAFIGLVILLLVASYYYSKAQKYDLSKVAEEQQQNTLLDHNGAPLLGNDSKESLLITYDQLPQHLVDALIAREDTNFEHHCGVDFKGLIRATLRNAKDMSFTQGASTLTMQLARNTYDIRAKSLNRKFLEIALTLRIESSYSKNEIMAYYLNRIYFGSGCYGIEQASRKYFKKSVTDLTLSESATLVGIIRGPHIFSPLNDLAAAQNQRNQVIDRMLTIGKLTTEQASAVKNSPLVLPQKITLTKKPLEAANPYALKALDRHLNEILAQKDIRAAGLTITSALDLKKLHQCENDIKKLLIEAKQPQLQAACIIIDHKTGAIRALVGGRDYKALQFNIALDGKLDLGDAFTPFIYAAALERGKLPIKGNPSQTGKQLDPAETQRIAKRFGFNSPFNLPEIHYGSGTCSPLELATAFSTIANNGKRPHTFFVEHITKADGSELFKNTAQSTPAIQEGTALETAKLLKYKDGIAYTTAAFSGRSLWSAASKDSLTAVIWVGFQQPAPVPNKNSLLKKMQSLTYHWVASEK